MKQITDAIITNPNDELYDLQTKYNVKISRSNASDAVYIFRKRSYIVRVGHPIPRTQKHLMNFRKNKEVHGKVTKDVVETVIKMYLNNF